MTIGVGLIGCGNIAPNYLQNAARHAGIAIRAVADHRPATAVAAARAFGTDAETVEGLLARPDVEIILNLTPPLAHGMVTRAALDAGKHVYSEKPLATTFAEGRTLAAEAAAHGLVIGCAPDTFLGASHQIARRLLDDGRIGRVIGGTAFFLSPGMEDWHPNPGFFFRRGGGPHLDMGPYHATVLVNLLGPVASVAALGSRGLDTRLVAAEGPLQGTSIPVEVPTSFWALLRFASGVPILLGLSWDVAAHGMPHGELYGTAGTLRLTDPDQFGGTVRLGTGMGGQNFRQTTRFLAAPTGTGTITGPWA
jgi:predicted dehydrogenase